MDKRTESSLKKFSKAVGAFIAVVLLAVILVPLISMLVMTVGYLVGMAVAYFIGGLTTGILGITAANIPTIFAWLFLLSSLVGAGSMKRND